MKTAYQTAKANGATFRDNGLVLIDQHDLMKCMQEYASQALDEAAKVASTKSVWDYDSYKDIIDKDSILKIKEELK